MELDRAHLPISPRDWGLAPAGQRDSPVLAAIGLEHSLAQANIILSLGKDNTDEDVGYFLDVFPKIVEKLRGMSPLWDEFQRGLVDSVVAPRGGHTATEQSLE